MPLKSILATAISLSILSLQAAPAQAGHAPGAHHHARQVRPLPPQVRYVDPRMPRTIVRYAAPRRPDFLIPAYLPRNTDAPMYNEPPPRFPQR